MKNIWSIVILLALFSTSCCERNEVKVFLPANIEKGTYIKVVIDDDQFIWDHFYERTLKIYPVNPITVYCPAGDSMSIYFKFNEHDTSFVLPADRNGGTYLYLEHHRNDHFEIYYDFENKYLSD